jgi:long-subunit fatty acid transport protein
MWSLSPNPQINVGVKLAGDVAEALGLDQALALDSSADASPGFVDILIPRAGVEFSPSESFTLRGGYWLRPTPIKDQTRKTNYLDSTTHGVAVGASFTFQDPIELFPNPLTVDATGQFVLLQERETTKREPGDPVGSYKSGGVVVHLDLTLRYTF